MTSPGSPTTTRRAMERVGLVLGPVLLIAFLLAPAPADMAPAAWSTAAVAVLMATWWLTEAVPIPVTALVPFVAFPLLGIASGAETAAPYANPIIYLFLGGFVIAIGVEQSGLHRRLVLGIMRLVGPQPTHLVGGMLTASAFMSMWISNTAATLLMLPLAASVVLVIEKNAAEGERDPNFAICLTLAAGYGATIGGMGTLIGTPPNALLAAFMLESRGVQIGFAQWMMIGVPMVIVGIPVCWFILTRVAFPIRIRDTPGGRELLAAEARALGPLSRAEWTVGTITALTAASWIFRPLLERRLPGLTDTTIAIAGALLLFLVPVDWRGPRAAISWKHAEQLPWSVLLLFGGGLSLASAVEKTTLAAWIGNALDPLSVLPLFLLILGVAAVILFLTELTSNTATAATFLPIAAALAVTANAHPMVLGVPAALAANCAFMLPVGTPPNAIVYATGRITANQMARAGIYLNIVFLGLIAVASLLLGPLLVPG